MVFLRNVSNIAVLEAELIRLKALYAKALETKNEATIKTLRKTIKSLKTKMTVVNSGSAKPIEKACDTHWPDDAATIA